jgi:uncharacterized membrane protein YphA (DoxX/SURF4 family)
MSDRTSKRNLTAAVSAVLAGYLTEAIGTVLLLIGSGVRRFSLPLMFAMLVAAFRGHWQHGW